MSYSEYELNEMSKGYLCRPKYKAAIIEEKGYNVVDVKSLHIGTGKIMYGYSNGARCYGNRTCSLSECILLECLSVTDSSGNDLFEGDVLVDNKSGEEFIIHRVNSPIMAGWVLINGDHNIIKDWAPQDYTRVDSIYNTPKQKVN